MSFSTKSYLAGVGTVVAALTIGFSGGFFLAPPAGHVEQNRLQRVASSSPISNPASQAAPAAKPEITEVRPIELVASAVPVPSPQQPSDAETIPVMAKAVEPAPTEPDRASAEDSAAKPEVRKPEISTDKMRAAEAKAERRRAKEQRRAERRKQREIELAAVAVKRMLRDRDPQQFADRMESPRFGFFGED